MVSAWLFIPLEKSKPVFHEPSLYPGNLHHHFFLGGFGAGKNNYPYPDTIRAFRFANVFQTEEDFDTKKLKTELIRVYGFDSRKNIIYTLDEKGLYFANEYDSLNNLVTGYFYEDLDSSGTKRIPSSKWIYKYANGLREQIDRYKFADGDWVFEESVRNTYLTDKSGRIIENNYYDTHNELKETIFYTYNSEPSGKQEPFNFNRGWYKNPSCSREVKKDASGKIRFVTDYEYDERGNCIRSKQEDFTDQRFKRIKRTEYTYSETGLLLEETVYIYVNAEYTMEKDYSTKRIYEYDEDGFETKYVSKSFDGFGSVKEYRYFK